MNLRSILFACLALGRLGAQGTPQTVKIACFGDSVTAGSRAEGQPWCKQLRKLLGTGYFATWVSSFWAIDICSAPSADRAAQARGPGEN